MAKEFAPGLPHKGKIDNIRRVSADKPEDWEFVIQEHTAERAGVHFDLRIGDPKTGHGHSWAMKNPLPGPGQKVGLVRQGTHTIKYFDFRGKIPEGYGKGKVKPILRSKVTVNYARDGVIKFKIHRGTSYTEKFRLMRTGGENWLLINHTLTREKRPDLADYKPTYKEDLEPVFSDKYDMQEKLNGAHAQYDFNKADRQIGAFSYRKSKRNPTGLIEHTYKIPNFQKMRTPKELVGTIGRGELVAVDKNGVAIRDTELFNGIINASTYESRRKQKELGVRIIPSIYDLKQFKGKFVEKATYDEKKKMLAEIHKALPGVFYKPKSATDPKKQEKLFNDIKAGRNKTTDEGVVFWERDGNRAIKTVHKPNFDVYVRRIFQEISKAGKKKDQAGGFEYSWTPTGKIVGKIGTGFSREMKKRMWRNQKDYIGRVAMSKSKRKIPKSGALFQPAFKGWHLEKGDIIEKIGSEGPEMQNVIKGFYKQAKLRAKVELKEHQVRVEKKLGKRPALLLYHGLGSGKTLSAINAIGEKNTDFVVPASLRTNAQKELKKFTTRNKADVMSYHGFLKKKDGKGGEALILDEAHRLGTSGTKTTQKVLEDAPHYATRILLTGSPIRNHPAELAPLIRILKEDAQVPLSKGDFAERFIEKVKIKPGFLARLRGVKPGVVEKMKNEAEFKKLIEGMVDYHKPGKEDYPGMTETIYRVMMSEPQQKLYNKAIGSMPFSVRHKIKKGLPLAPSEKVYLNTFANSTRQISNSVRSFGIEDDTPKMRMAVDHVKEMVDKNKKGKALIYSNFLSSGVEECARMLKDKGISFKIFDGSLNDKERKKMVDEYNKDKIQALLISGAGSEGLDLKGTRMVQILEPHWNLARTDQVQGRAARYKSHSHLPEEERHVDVRRYHTILPEKLFGLIKADKSADDYLHELGKRKKDLNDQFLKLLKQEGLKKEGSQFNLCLEDIYSIIQLLG